MVRKILSGETVLFETIIKRHNKLLYGVAYNVLRNSTEAEEILQDSYCQAYRHLSQFAGKSKLSTWLARITLYAALAHSRRRKRFIGIDSIQEFKIPFQIHNNPEKKVLASEMQVAMSRAIALLPEIYRSVFLSREVQGLNTAETAVALGVTEKVIKTRLNRARNLLREHLYGFLHKSGSEPVIAIDLGTANIRVYVPGHRVIFEELSLVKRDPGTGVIYGPGSHTMRDFNVEDVISPLHGGVIVDVDQTVSLLKPLVERAARKLGRKKPKALVCIPSDATPKERIALIDATLRAGISSVAIFPEPLAAAMGAGLDVTSGCSRMVVDIGDGVTDIAVIKSGALLKTGAIRLACSDIYESLRLAIKESYGMHLQPLNVAILSQQLGLQASNGTDTIRINGMNIGSNKEAEIDVSIEKLFEASTPVTDRILKTIHDFLRDLSDPVACEVNGTGIHLTGGGASFPGLSQRIEKETLLSVHTIADPLHAVIDGARQMVTTGISMNQWETIRSD